MTKDEAKTIAAIMMHADGGCAHCAASLQERLVACYPDPLGFNWADVLNEVWMEEGYEENENVAGILEGAASIRRRMKG